jgi:O-antigen/teichoic acid export membrane protein
VVRGRAIGDLISITLRTATAVLGASIIAVPAVMAVADTGLTATVAAFATAPLLVIIAAGQGFLQGSQRFSVLSWVLAGVGVARTFPGVAALAFGAGATGALTATAIGAAVAAAVIWLIVFSDRAVDAPVSDSPVAEAVALRLVLHASQVQLVLIALSSVDLLAARPILGEHDAGVYALGTIATKAAFWLPQAIGVVLYPQLADAAKTSDALRTAVLWLIAIAAVVVAGATICGPLVPVLAGDDYRPVVPILWVFALAGSSLSVLQVGLLAAIARDRTRIALLSWLVLAAEAILVVLLAHSIVTLAVIAATCAVAGTVLTLGALGATRSDRSRTVDV